MFARVLSAEKTSLAVCQWSQILLSLRCLLSAQFSTRAVKRSLAHFLSSSFFKAPPPKKRRGVFATYLGMVCFCLHKLGRSSFRRGAKTGRRTTRFIRKNRRTAPSACEPRNRSWRRIFCSSRPPMPRFDSTQSRRLAGKSKTTPTDQEEPDAQK